MFSQWVKAIDISRAKPQPLFADLLKRATWVLTFNYTDTVEKVYHLAPRKVFHIHGQGRAGGELIFGCALPKAPLPHAGGDNQVSAAARTEGRRQLVHALVKPLQVGQLQYEGETRGTTRLDEVNSVGFSFSEVDQPYVNELATWCDESTVWTHFCRDQGSVDAFYEAMQKAQFPGCLQVRKRRNQHDSTTLTDQSTEVRPLDPEPPAVD